MPYSRLGSTGNASRSITFVDDEHLALVQNVTRVLEEPTRSDVPVLARDQDWEDMLFLNGAWTVLPDPDGEGLVAWYENWGFDVRRANARRSEFVESGGRARFTAPEFSRMEAMVARSRDGVTWTKPTRDMPKGTHARTNVILGDDRVGNVHAFAVAQAAAGSGARYRALFVNESRTAPSTAPVIRSASSADGMEWAIDGARPTFGSSGDRMGDVMCLSHDPDGGYLLFGRHPEQIRPRRSFPAVRVTGSFFPPYVPEEGFAENKRRIWLTRSRDFTEWSEPVEVVVPEFGTSNLDESFYNLSHAFNGDLHIGFLTVLHEVENTVDVRLVSSRDLITWKPVAGDRALLAPRDGWEAGTVNVCSGPIVAGDEWWVYYGATPYHHDWWWVGEREGLETFESFLSRGEYSLGLARFGAGRLVGLSAGMRPGLILTDVVPEGPRRIRVNARTSHRGSVRVAVTDHAGQSLPGLPLEDCGPLTGDHLARAVEWRGEETIDLPPGSRILVALHEATVFGLELESPEHG